MEVPTTKGMFLKLNLLKYDLETRFNLEDTVGCS